MLKKCTMLVNLTLNTVELMARGGLVQDLLLTRRCVEVQGHLAHKKTPNPLGPP